MGPSRWDNNLSNKSQKYTFKVSYAETDTYKYMKDDITAEVMAH